MIVRALPLAPPAPAAAQFGKIASSALAAVANANPPSTVSAFRALLLAVDQSIEARPEPSANLKRKSREVREDKAEIKSPAKQSDDPSAGQAPVAPQRNPQPKPPIALTIPQILSVTAPTQASEKPSENSAQPLRRGAADLTVAPAASAPLAGSSTSEPAPESNAAPAPVPPSLPASASSIPAPLAFSARLHPLEEASSKPLQPAKPQESMARKASNTAPQASARSRADEPEPAGEVRPATRPSSKPQNANPRREESEDSAPTPAVVRIPTHIDSPRVEAPAPSAGPTTPQVTPQITQPGPAPVAAVEPHPVSSPAAATVAAPVIEIAKPAPSPAPSAIQLSLDQNGQRVDLRVSERAGDIHVAVRTPDPQLAEAMRTELPALSSKLEQSGLRGELWHPASGENGVRRLETSAGASSSGEPHDGGGRRGQDPPHQDQKQARHSNARKTDRKEFSWQFESLL